MSSIKLDAFGAQSKPKARASLKIDGVIDVTGPVRPSTPHRLIIANNEKSVYTRIRKYILQFCILNVKIIDIVIIYIVIIYLLIMQLMPPCMGSTVWFC